MSLPAGASRHRTLLPGFARKGSTSVTARIHEDRLPADDKRTIVVRAIREARVLLVDGEAKGEPRESETFFLRHALQPVSPEESRSYFIHPVVVPATELGGARFDDYEAVMLANVAAVLRGHGAQPGGLPAARGRRGHLSRRPDQRQVL